MDKQLITTAVKTLKSTTPKRNFSQTVDLIVNLRNLDMKKQENNIDLYIPLHYDRGKKIKVCGVVGAELTDQSRQVFDGTITTDELIKYKDNKKAVKKLANQYDFFVAQSNVMPQVATAFGRVFGPRGKMPNPKAGCVVLPNANLKPLYERLQKTVRVQTKNHPSVKCAVGTEAQDEEQLIDNILTAYQAISHAIPKEEDSIRDVSIKLTMSQMVKIEASKEEVVAKKKKR